MVRDISEILNGDRGSKQSFDAHPMGIVVWPGERFLNESPNIKKCTFFNIEKLTILVVFKFSPSYGRFYSFQQPYYPLPLIKKHFIEEDVIVKSMLNRRQ